MRRDTLNDFLEFIRFRLCVFAPILGASGYLLYGNVSPGLLLVMLVAFLMCTGTYAYNNIHDIEEDLVNRKHVSSFTYSRWACIVVLLCFAIGMFLSLVINLGATILSLIIISLGFIYSYFRLKKYLLVKNLYTGFGIGLLFLLGAFSAGYYQLDLLAYYVFFSALVLAGSLISDLRDKIGDMKAGVNTIPVVFGEMNTKNAIYVLLAFVSLLALFFIQIVPIFFLVFAICVFLVKNKYGIAHVLDILSVLFVSFWIAIF